MIKITEKDIKENYQVVTLGYCSIAELEPYLTQIGYTSGVYGWKSDLYISVDNIVLSTGYDPVNGCYPSHELLHNFIIQCTKAIDSIDDFNERRQKIRALFNEFMKKSINESRWLNVN